MTSRKGLTPKKKERFFSALVETGGNVFASSREIGMPLQRMYLARERDEDFAALWDEAITAGIENAEQELYRRAVEGVDEPIFYRGERVDTLRRYSDALLMFLLKSRLPSVYRDRVTKQADLPPVQINIVTGIEGTPGCRVVS